MPDPHETAPDPAGASRPARADAIRVVSDLLSRKGPPLDRPPAPAPLPTFPRPLEATIAGLRKAPGLRAKFDWPRALVSPPLVKPPEGGPPDRPGEGDLPPGGGATPGSPGPGDLRPSTVGAGGGPPDRGDGPSRPGRLEAGDRGPAGDVGGPGDRLGPPSAPLPDGLGSPQSAIDLGEATSDVSGADGRATPPTTDPAGVVGRLADPTEPPGARIPSIGPSRDLRLALARPALDAESARLGGPPPGPGGAVEAGPPPPDRASGSPIAVRNPLASGSRSFPSSPLGPPGDDGPAPGPDPSGLGAGPGGPAPGRSTTPSGGGAADLSKTNELLRQLIDAVKRQRDSSLPAGGPSVYPGR